MNDAQNKVIFKDDKGKETLVVDLGVFAHNDILLLKEAITGVNIKEPVTVEDLSSIIKKSLDDSDSKVDQFNEFSLTIKADVNKNEETKIVENDPISTQSDIIKTMQEFASGIVVRKASEISKEKEANEKDDKKDENSEEEGKASTKILKGQKPSFLKSDNLVTVSDGLSATDDKKGFNAKEEVDSEEVKDDLEDKDKDKDKEKEKLKKEGDKDETKH